jgi:hypothetical protein
VHSGDCSGFEVDGVVLKIDKLIIQVGGTASSLCLLSCLFKNGAEATFEQNSMYHCHLLPYIQM